MFKLLKKIFNNFFFKSWIFNNKNFRGKLIAAYRARISIEWNFVVVSFLSISGKMTFWNFVMSGLFLFYFFPSIKSIKSIIDNKFFVVVVKMEIWIEFCFAVIDGIKYGRRRNQKQKRKLTSNENLHALRRLRWSVNVVWSTSIDSLVLMAHFMEQ